MIRSWDIPFVPYDHNVVFVVIIRLAYTPCTDFSRTKKITLRTWSIGPLPYRSEGIRRLCDCAKCLQVISIDIFEDDAPPTVCVYMPQPDFDFLRLWQVQRSLRE